MSIDKVNYGERFLSCFQAKFKLRMEILNLTWPGITCSRIRTANQNGWSCYHFSQEKTHHPLIPVIIYNYYRKYAVPLFLGHPVYKDVHTCSYFPSFAFVYRGKEYCINWELKQGSFIIKYFVSLFSMHIQQGHFLTVLISFWQNLTLFHSESLWINPPTIQHLDKSPLLTSWKNSTLSPPPWNTRLQMLLYFHVMSQFAYIKA